MNTLPGSNAPIFGSDAPVSDTRTSTRRFRSAGIGAALIAGALVATAATALLPGAANASEKAGIVNVKWAGYAATGTRFSAATGTWTVPTATCGQSDPRSTFVWVGLDGASAGASTVEQAGTGISCGSDGTARHFAWTEFYPNLSSILDPNAYPVQPGDDISTSITAGSDNFAVMMSDQRNGATLWSYSATIASAGAQFTSAEWIVEAPSATAGGADMPIMPVDTTFTNVTATTAAGVTSGLNGNRFNWQSITLRQGDSSETPNALDSTTTSFSVSGGSGSTAAATESWMSVLAREKRVLSPNSPASGMRR